MDVKLMMMNEAEILFTRKIILSIVGFSLLKDF